MDVSDALIDYLSDILHLAKKTLVVSRHWSAIRLPKGHLLIVFFASYDALRLVSIKASRSLTLKGFCTMGRSGWLAPMRSNSRRLAPEITISGSLSLGMMARMASMT